MDFSYDDSKCITQWWSNVHVITYIYHSDALTEYNMHWQVADTDCVTQIIENPIGAKRGWLINQNQVNWEQKW